MSVFLLKPLYRCWLQFHHWSITNSNTKLLRGFFFIAYVIYKQFFFNFISLSFCPCIWNLVPDWSRIIKYCDHLMAYSISSCPFTVGCGQSIQCLPKGSWVSWMWCRRYDKVGLSAWTRGSAEFEMSVCWKWDICE